MDADGSAPQALPKWISEEYFRSLFRRKSPGEEITVKKVDVSFTHHERTNGKLVRAVVDVVTAAGAASRSYVVKSTATGAFAATPACTNQYRTEALLLGKVVPAMHRVLEAVAPGKFGPLAPELADSGVDENRFIMTDDLSVRGFYTVRRQTRMDLEHSLAFAKHLGVFHAASVAVLDRFQADLDAIPLLINSEESKHLNGYIDNSMKNVLSVLESWKDSPRYATIVKPLAASLPQRLAEANRRRDSKLAVVCHGDMFVNNIVFRRDGDGKVCEVRLVDFQLSRVGSFADDLVGVLVSATSDDVLFDHSEEFLEEYRASLNETLRLLGLEGKSLSGEDVAKEVREQRAVAQFALFHMLPHTRSSGAPDLGDGRAAFSSAEYQSILRVVLPRFKTLGWLDESDVAED